METTNFTLNSYSVNALINTRARNTSDFSLSKWIVENWRQTEHYTEYLEAAKYLQKLNYNDARQSTIRRVEEAIDKMEQERLFGKSN